MLFCSFSYASKLIKLITVNRSKEIDYCKNVLTRPLIVRRGPGIQVEAGQCYTQCHTAAFLVVRRLGYTLCARPAARQHLER